MHIPARQPAVFSSSRSKTLPRLAKLETIHISKIATYISSPGPGTLVPQKHLGTPGRKDEETRETAVTPGTKGLLLLAKKNFPMLFFGGQHGQHSQPD